jgi:hypothetical protein
MMLFLMIDVMTNFSEIITPKTKHAISLLPLKLEPRPDVPVHAKGGRSFDLANKITDKHSR